VLSLPVRVMFCAPAAAEDETETVTFEVAPGRIEAGLKLTVTPAGAEAVKATEFLAVPLAVTLSEKLVELPVSTVPLVEPAFRVKSTPAAVLAPPPQTLTSTAPSTDPNPVARLYEAPLALKPVTPGTVLLPERVAWNGLCAAFKSG